MRIFPELIIVLVATFSAMTEKNMFQGNHVLHTREGQLQKSVANPRNGIGAPKVAIFALPDVAVPHETIMDACFLSFVKVPEE